MDKQKKSLLCMYIDNFCGIKEESFNFHIERRYTIKEEKISRKSDEEIKGFPKDFWGDNVSAVTLLIGENGAGKTTLMRLLIKWLCQLSAGNFPQEKGALVISDNDSNSDYGNRDKLIAFDRGTSWSIEKDECKEIVCLADINEIKKLLSDICLAYYTDTMTDLELSDTLTAEELKFLQDDSLLTRLSNSIKSKYTVDSIKDCIRRKDFERQMTLFLNMFSHSKKNLDTELEFPIRYMKLTAIKAGDQKAFKKIADDNGSLIGKATDFWNEMFSDDVNNKLPDIVKDLLWGLFTGTILSLLQWERTLPDLKEGIVAKQVSDLLIAYIRNNYYDWNTCFKRFFTNLFLDCERGFRVVKCHAEFRDVWGKKVEDDIEGFLDALKKFANGEFQDKWKPSENAQNAWEFRLEYFSKENTQEKKNGKDKKEEKDKKDENEQSGLIQNWKNFWESYLAVAHLMPGCRFDWRYPSSGEINKANLYCTMRVVDIGKHNNAWFLLDEPDNTFHPDWKRGTIRDLLEVCSTYKKGVKINYQLLISTHSPIMLSDVPKQAAILLKSSDKKENSDKSHYTAKKQQKYPESSPFGQQLYTLFQDSFFMEQGVIGAFADDKISKTYSTLVKLEKDLRKNVMSEKKLNECQEKLEKSEYIIKLIDEPLLEGYLLQLYNWCSKRFKEWKRVRKSNKLLKEGIFSDST